MSVTTITIKNCKTGEALFSHTCENNTPRKTVEAAVKQKVSLNYADLSGIDLSTAKIQGAKLYGASLRGAILWGISISRSDCRHVDFSDSNCESAYFGDTTLVGASFAETSCVNASFVNCDARAISGARKRTFFPALIVSSISLK